MDSAFHQLPVRITAATPTVADDGQTVGVRTTEHLGIVVAEGDLDQFADVWLRLAMIEPPPPRGAVLFLVGDDGQLVSTT